MRKWQIFANTAKKILGEDEVITSMPGPNLGGEDFAYYAEQKPSDLCSEFFKP